MSKLAHSNDETMLQIESQRDDAEEFVPTSNNEVEAVRRYYDQMLTKQNKRLRLLDARGAPEEKRQDVRQSIRKYEIILNALDALLATPPTPAAVEQTIPVCGSCGDSPEHEWTLISPDGGRWVGQTKMEAYRAELNSRVPATVQLERIMAAVDEGGEQQGELTELRAAFEKHMQQRGFSTLRSDSDFEDLGEYAHAVTSEAWRAVIALDREHRPKVADGLSDAEINRLIDPHYINQGTRLPELNRLVNRGELLHFVRICFAASRPNRPPVEPVANSVLRDWVYGATWLLHCIAEDVAGSYTEDVKQDILDAQLFLKSGNLKVIDCLGDMFDLHKEAMDRVLPPIEPTEGTVMLPREPTEAMCKAGGACPQMKVINGILATSQIRAGQSRIDGLGATWDTSAIAEVYRAMLEASK